MDYVQLAQEALTLIEESGAPVSIKRIQKDRDPVKGTIDSAVFIEGSFAAVKLPVKSNIASKLEKRLQDALVDGKLCSLLVAAYNGKFDLAPKDIVNLEEDYWMIYGVSPLAPAGTTLLYNVIAEKVSLSDVALDAIDIEALEAQVARFATLVNVTMPPLIA